MKRTVTTFLTGTYQLTMNVTNTNLPDIAYLSGDAPTSYTIDLEWELKDEEIPVEVAG